MKRAAISGIICLASIVSGPALSGGPDVSGTWSVDCRTLPPLETMRFDSDSVQVADRRCQFVSWTKTDAGWHSPLSCSTEGRINSGQIIIAPEGPTRLQINMDGLRGTFSKCTTLSLSERLDGVWARDLAACRLYRSGELEKRGYDTAALIRFGVATIQSGRLEMLASPIRCQFSPSREVRGMRISIAAQCQIKDYPARASTGAVSFTSSGGASLELRGSDFGKINLAKCD